MKRFAIIAGLAVLSTSAMAQHFVGSWSSLNSGGVGTNLYDGAAVRFKAIKTGGVLPGGLPAEAVTHLNAAGGFFTFCAELGETIGYTTNTHERVEMVTVGTQTWKGGSTGSVTFNLSQVNKLGRLYYNAISAWGGVGGAGWTNDRAAAFQLAQWEILFDGGTTDFTSGVFQLDNGNLNARYSDAQALITGANTFGAVANLILLSDNLGSTSGLIQDQITGYISSNPPNTVPEPFTMGLGAAAAGLFVRRRLKAKASLA